MCSDNTAEIISNLIYNSNKAKDLLMQVTELPLFNNVLTPGEKTSVHHMVKKLNDRISSLKETQEQFL